MIPIPDRPKQVHPQAVAICAGILLIGVWMSWYNLSGVWRARNWDSWREVKGKVIEGSVRGGRKSRNISCDYAYTVNGELYTNNVVTLMSSAGHQGGGVTAGAAVTVYYDPANPQNSALGQGNPLNSWLWGIVGLVVLVFGSILVLVSLFPGRLPRVISAEDPHDPGEPV